MISEINQAKLARLAIADSTDFPIPQRKANWISPPIELIPQYTPYEPSQVYLFGNIHPDYLLILPLPLNIERDNDGTFVISDDIFLVYGYGKDRLKAMKDYVNSFIDYFEAVKRNSDKNQFDKLLFSSLQTYMQCTSSMRDNNATQTTRD